MTAKVYDVLATGIAAVDDLLYVATYPPPNVKIPISRTARHPGGLACTAVAAVGKLGGQAAYIARFGHDDLSSFMKTSLAAINVDVSPILNDPAGQPFHSTIIVDDSGARTIFYDCSQFRPISADDLSESLIRSARIFFLDYLMDPPAIEVARKVRNLGIPILADIEGRSDSALPLLPLIDYLIVSEEFARWATGIDDLSAACARLARSPRAATVVTAGPQGCYLATSPDTPTTHIPAFQVTVLDTNGCGDTFHGAFALAIARNFTPHEASAFASAAAAIKATGRGGWASLPTAPEVLKFLKNCLKNDENMRDFLEKAATLSSTEK